MTRLGQICAVVVIAMVIAGLASARIRIVEDGEARAVIMLGPGASEPQRHAAEELARFLREITDREFPIVDKLQQNKTHLIIRATPAYDVLYEHYSLPDKLGPDAVHLQMVGDDLIFWGGDERGKLYAVYTFLEDFLGCRWWSSTESTIPKRKTIVFDTLQYTYVPPLEYRSPFWTDAFDGDWSARNKANGQTHGLEARHGGKHIYEGFVHTFYPLIPPEKYFADHPEWFSEINGKRTTENAQLCLTNEEMRKELVKNLKERLRNNPLATIASVSQNDCHGNCQCAKCKAIEEEEGSPAGLMLRFVNAVSADIEQEFPHVAISTLAYQYTRKPPKITKPRPNVIVQLCSIECSFCKPLADERNKAFRDDIIGWSQISNRLYIWDYTTNFRHYFLPHPNLRVLGPNVKFFADHSVAGVFEQGAYTTYGAEMAELRAWVLAKLLWDPTRDGQALVDEFIDGYYGPAASEIKAYLKVTHDAVEASGDWLGCFEETKARFISLDTLSRGWQHLQAAEQAVADDPVLLFRVQVAELPVMYATMMRWKDMRQAAKALGVEWFLPDSIQTNYDQFMTIAKKKNVTRLNEWQEGFGNLDNALAENK